MPARQPRPLLTADERIAVARDEALEAIYTKIAGLCRVVPQTEAGEKPLWHTPPDQEHLATAIHTLAIAATRLEAAR